MTKEYDIIDNEDIVIQLKRIASALEKMNDIKKEKDKANLKGILSEGEIEYLIATQKKK